MAPDATRALKFGARASQATLVQADGDVMAGLIVHYTLSAFFVFAGQDAGKSQARLVSEYAITGLAGVVIAAGILYAAVEIAGLPAMLAKGAAVRCVRGLARPAVSAKRPGRLELALPNTDVGPAGGLLGVDKAFRIAYEGPGETGADQFVAEISARGEASRDQADETFAGRLAGTPLLTVPGAVLGQLRRVDAFEANATACQRQGIPIDHAGPARHCRRRRAGGHAQDRKDHRQREGAMQHAHHQPQAILRTETQ
jgi:hypothetical protein